MKSKRTVSLVLPLTAAVCAALSPAPAAAESMSAAADAAVAASRPLKAAGSLSAGARESRCRKGGADAIRHALREPLPV